MLRVCAIVAAAVRSCPTTSPMTATHASSGSSSASYQSPPTRPRSSAVAGRYTAAASNGASAGIRGSSSRWKCSALERTC